MKTLVIDFKKYNTKHKLLEFFSSQLEGLYGLNYDALIDVLSYEKKPMNIKFIHKDNYEDLEELLNIFEIIQKENSNIKLEA